MLQSKPHFTFEIEIAEELKLIEGISALVMCSRGIPSFTWCHPILYTSLPRRR